MAEGVQAFGEIWLGSRGGVSSGQLKLTPSGFVWRRKQGSKVVEVKKEEIEGLSWTKVPRGCQLSVRRKGATTLNFLGFRDKDLESLQQYTRNALALPEGISEEALATGGHNWGAVQLRGASLAFMVGGKVAFEMPLPDVCTAQQNKDDVMLELHVDDTGGEVAEDMLQELAFYVPPGNEEFPARADDVPAAKVMLDALLPHADTEAAAADEPVCVFSEVGILAPRGRFDIEMHLGYLQLGGQSQDFKVRYTSIQRIFILPKQNTPHTLVVISLDPPIRKGQTYYAHLLCQFPTEDDITVELDITEEALVAKNEKNGGKLATEMSGPVHEVFAKLLRGLSGARITKPGHFRNAGGEGFSVRCSYKADDGQLYPLDRGFFYVHKPPLLIPDNDIESVEFARQGSGAVSSSVRTFDLVIRLKGGTEHMFRNIQRSEWGNLFEFINTKKIPIENLATAKRGPGGAHAGLDADDDMDPGMRRAAAEADYEDDEDEDEDFDGGSGGSESSEDEDEDSDAEMIEEDGVPAEAFKLKGKRKESGGSAGDMEERPAKKPAKEKPTPAPKNESAGGGDAGGSGGKGAGKGKGKKAEPAEGGKPKKEKKVKDPNAPKKNLTAFMYFSGATRDKVKAENPGIAFGEVGKMLGERWKAMSSEDKAPFEQMAVKDKVRYAEAMKAYKEKGGGAAAGKDAGGEVSDAGGEDDE
ncbi:hypothetical protein PLESTB_001348900 [Pleodorina starrii]|uniref:FACT complex subunit SSRP1 n=1 Tax=Pleodorina starrii TaxID=330485 RepID=A0A9W6BTU5_9CHLO|nr:hypothetical protein PLESTM_000897900 [Pleodorina starrii]GLC58346.1 hypothetical protein PLESTB_001348900 [Pleodorina starrii]GLC69442.1 hypothetical protein PLESTF_000831100 [Pleodorina starrii]